MNKPKKELPAWASSAIGWAVAVALILAILVMAGKAYSIPGVPETISELSGSEAGKGVTQYLLLSGMVAGMVLCMVWEAVSQISDALERRNDRRKIKATAAQDGGQL